MKDHRAWVTAALLAMAALAVCAGAGQPSADSVLNRLTPEQREKLLAGKDVYEPALKYSTEPGGEPGFTAAAMIIINAPVEQCYRMFCDFDKQYLYFPAITKSQVLSKTQNRVVIYKELDYRVTVIKYTHILTLDPMAHRVDFVTDPNGVNDAKYSRGFFQFEKIDDNRTLFTYGLAELDPGVRIPEFLKNYMTARDLPRMAVNLRKYIESGGKWRK